MALVNLQVKNNAKLVARKTSEVLRRESPHIARTRLKAAALDIKKRMSTPGKKVRYPLQWLHDAQRIAVIIKLRKSGNLPYKRSREAERSWSVTEISGKGFGVSTSLGRKYKYLYGDTSGQHQQPMFRGRWKLLFRETQIVLNTLPKTVVNNLKQVIRGISQVRT